MLLSIPPLFRLSWAVHGRSSPQLSSADQRAKRLRHPHRALWAQSSGCQSCVYVLTCKKVVCVMRVCVFQSTHVGVGCVSGDILCRYSISGGHLFVRNCASILRVQLDSICSSLQIFGDVPFNTPLFVLLCKCFWTISVWIWFMLCFIVLGVVVSGAVPLFVV